jgi:flagella basal body P-ring formation protein FlgA
VDANATRQAEIVSRQLPRPRRERVSALIKEARERARRRRRRIAAAVIVLSAAAAILVFGGVFNTGYLSHHRNSVTGSTELGTVLVAKRLIPKGTSGSSIATQNLFVVVTVPKVQIAPKAISDPAVLQGRVSAADIYPREQLATSAFTTPH